LKHFAALLVMLAATGCATHRAALHSYRLLGTGSSQVLVPPGMEKPETSQRTFDADVSKGNGTCPSSSGGIGVRPSRKRVRVTVTQEELRNRPAGWLTEWATSLESQGCIAPGAGPQLAEQIAEALPLDPNQEIHLLYSSQLDIFPQMRVQVLSPILGDANGPILESVQTSGNDRSITAAIRSSDNLLGYETAAYEVQAKTDGPGVRVVPLYADRHVGDAVERKPEPAVNYFRFPREAAFYRVFYEAQQTEYTAFVIGAGTRAELDQRTRTFETGATSCEELGLCVPVPKQVAINGLVRVTVNGKETWVNWGTNVGGVIRAGGERDRSGVPPTLKVEKLYRGKLTAVEFDRATSNILSLVLTGGEVVSWK
jgi:hypothetical protein